MPGGTTKSSARRSELLDAAYRYALEHGLLNVSLRSVASAIGSSPGVLMFLFRSKDAMVRELLARAGREELDLLEELRSAVQTRRLTIGELAERTWAWLVVDRRRSWLRLSAQAYVRDLREREGAWTGFACTTAGDWMDVLAAGQAEGERDTHEGAVVRHLTLTVLRGAALELLTTGNEGQVSAAVRQHLVNVRQQSSPRITSTST